jgi:hypothetical protein
MLRGGWASDREIKAMKSNSHHLKGIDIYENHKQMERNNCAFDKVEILPNNVGYVKFDGLKLRSRSST